MGRCSAEHAALPARFVKMSAVMMYKASHMISTPIRCATCSYSQRMTCVKDGGKKKIVVDTLVVSAYLMLC